MRRVDFEWRNRVPSWLWLGVIPLAIYALLPASDRPEAPAAALQYGMIAPQPIARASHENAQSHHENATVPESTIETRTLGRGGTLAGALEALGIDAEKRRQTIDALGTKLDLRRLPAATGLTATRDAAGRVSALAVRAEVDRYVRVVEDASGSAVAHVVALPTLTRIDFASGRVVSSVYQALSSLPMAHDLTLAFADIFQWDIDLFIEPRPGDVVRMVYETRILGDVPRDLPPFGDAASGPGERLGLGHVVAASYDGRIVHSAAYRVEGHDGFGEYYDAQGRPLRKTFLRSPLNYRRISSRFSRARRHPITRKVVPHHGVDFAAATGTPVVAAADGNVTSAGWDGALGRAVRIRHGSEYTTLYGHLRGFAGGIRQGVAVRQGQLIGYVGSTGRATGPHLHYSLLERGRPIDPMGLKNASVEPLAPGLRPAFERARLTWSPVLAGTETVAEAVASPLDRGVDSGPRRGV